MTVVYEADEMAVPNNPQDPLHKYHPEIEDRVNVGVVGLMGRSSQIKSVVLSGEADVSEIETWLNTSLSRLSNAEV